MLGYGPGDLLVVDSAMEVMRLALNTEILQGSLAPMDMHPQEDSQGWTRTTNSRRNRPELYY